MACEADERHAAGRPSSNAGAGPAAVIRWTIGDVSERGFEALRLSIRGAYGLFGPAARFIVCVNTMAVDEARRRTGPVPAAVGWHQSSLEEIPTFLRDHLDLEMAEGVAWKFAPVRLAPAAYEIALDNDCILWRLPDTIRKWLACGDRASTILAEDIRPGFGQFANLCGSPRNSGIRGLPPGLDYDQILREVLRDHPVVLGSELDEQGLQTAALVTRTKCSAVTVSDVSLCSPFHPHSPTFGRCGAHFVGLNVKHIPWNYYDRPADGWMDEHWRRCRPELARLVGAGEFCGSDPELAQTAPDRF